MRRRQLLRIPAQKKNFVRKEMTQGPSQKLGKQDGGEQHQVKSRSPVLIALLEKPVNTQVEEGRKPPDVLRVRRAIAQEPAENADKNFVRKEIPQGPSQKLGKQDGGEQHQVKSRVSAMD